jgi:hypothetical protein
MSRLTPALLLFVLAHLLLIGASVGIAAIR